MIVPMKKVSMAVFGKDREFSLDKLREVGVLHIDKKNVSSEALVKLLDRQAAVRKAYAILSRYNDKKDIHHAYQPTSDKELVVYVLGLMDEKKILQDQLLHNKRERARIEPWGDFDPQSFADLEKNGISLIPYELSRRAYDALGDDIELIVLEKDSRKVRVLSVGKKIQNATPVAFAQSLTQIDERIEYINKRIDEIEKEFKNQAHRIKTLEDEDKYKLPIEIEYEATKAGMEELEDVQSVLWLTGFIPADKLVTLQRAAVEYGWAMVWSDPAPEDKPPTLIKNNSTINIIKPVFAFLGTVPGYREIDISGPFLVFFSIFVGMILGDAAYGTMFFTISIIASIACKIKSGKVPDMLKLLMVLTFCTIIWGAINGSWFSIPVEHLPAFLTALIIPPFNNTEDLIRFPGVLQNYFSLPEAIPKDQKSTWCVQFLCFSIALIHMCYGRIVCFVKTLPRLSAFSHVGYMLILAGLYFLVLNMLLGLKMQPFVVPMIGIGLGFNFIFSEQNGGNFFKNIGKSFANAISLILKAISTFADIISYIRLFAVGLAGSIIAETFNGMAIPSDGFGSPGVSFAFKILAAVLVLALGHGLNLILAVLSVIVHAVRLNLLEFAGNHLNIEWSGYEYKPFAIKQKK